MVTNIVTTTVHAYINPQGLEQGPEQRLTRTMILISFTKKLKEYATHCMSCHNNMMRGMENPSATREFIGNVKTKKKKKH